MQTNNPCFHCTNRHAACHASCEAYTEWSAQRSAQRQAAWEKSLKTREADNRLVDSKIKLRKRKER